jgi:hypothetical protein
MTTRADNATGIRNLCGTAIHLSGHMPDSAATKFAIRAVLREAVNKSNPEYKGNNNSKNCLFISLDAEALPNDSLVDLVSDHAIPISLLIKEFYANKNHEIDQLVELVSKYAVMVLITEAEDDKLAAAGLIKKCQTVGTGRMNLLATKRLGLRSNLI